MSQYEAIVVGTPTRFGRMSSQMASFWDTAGGVWAQGLLTGKVGAAFTSSAAQHGGQETTLFNLLTNLLHFGLTIVGLDYGYAGQLGVDEVRRSEEHTSELQSLMRISYAGFCLKKKT